MSNFVNFENRIIQNISLAWQWPNLDLSTKSVADISRLGICRKPV